MAEGTKTGACKVRSVVYADVCSLCEKDGLTTRYIGKTARTLLERNIEHQQDIWDKEKTSHIRDHVRLKHQENMERVMEVFNMKPLKNRHSALSRQVREAVEISMDSSNYILTLKKEYNRCILNLLASCGLTQSQTARSS